MPNPPASAAASAHLAALFAVPWSAFVATFLYYVLLAAILLAGVSPGGALVGVSYLAPAVAYAVSLTSRAVALIPLSRRSRRVAWAHRQA